MKKETPYTNIKKSDIYPANGIVWCLVSLFLKKMCNAKEKIKEKT